MFYCEKCMHASETDRCSNCKSKGLREIKADDFVYAGSCDFIWTNAAEDILKSAGIPYYKRSVRGEGMAIKLGYTAESFNIFVPYQRLSEADELLKQLDDSGEEEGADE